MASSSTIRVPAVNLELSPINSSSSESSGLSSSRSPWNTPSLSILPSPSPTPQTSLPSADDSVNDSVQTSHYPFPFYSDSKTQSLSPTAGSSLHHEHAPPSSDAFRQTTFDQVQDGQPALSESARAQSWADIRSYAIHRKSLQTAIAVLSLVMTIIALFLYGLRSYRMAKWSVRNDLLQMCAGLIQAQLPGGPDCEEVIAEGPTLPPYVKRRSSRAHQFAKRAARLVWRTENGIGAGNHALNNDLTAKIIYVVTVLLFAAVVLGGLIILLRSTAREQEVFVSPARLDSNVIIRPQYTRIVEVIQPESVLLVETCDPGEEVTAGQHIRCRILQHKAETPGMTHGHGRPWEQSKHSFRDSTDTLVGDWVESLEFEATPSSIIISPKNPSHHEVLAIARLDDDMNLVSPGLSDLLNSVPAIANESGELFRSVRARISVFLKRFAVRVSAETTEELRAKARMLQRAGDCLSGHLTNESPTGKPTLV